MGNGSLPKGQFYTFSVWLIWDEEFISCTERGSFPVPAVPATVWSPYEEHQWKSSSCTFMLPKCGWHTSRSAQNLWAITAKLAAPTQSLCLLQKLTSHLTEKVKHSTYLTARLSHNPHTDGIAKINLCLFATCYKNSLIALTYWNIHCIFPLNIATWIQ